MHGNNEDTTADFLSTLHVIFSMLGLMMRLKWAGWMAVFFCTANFANARFNDENRQILMSSMMSVFSVVMCYVQNPLPMTLPLT
jgi:hypothetical protein